MRLPDEVGQGFEKWLQAKLHQPSRLIGCEAKCKLGCGAYEPKQHSSSDCNEDIFPDLLRVELDMKAKGCGIAVTTGIVTKVSAGSVHWGRCEGSTTDLGYQICTLTIPFDTLVTGMALPGGQND